MTPPGDSIEPDFVVVEFAMSTAKYGRNTAPSTGMTTHQPGTTMQRMMQTQMVFVVM